MPKLFTETMSPSQSNGMLSSGGKASDKTLMIDDDLLIDNSGVTYSGKSFTFDRVIGLMYLAEVNSIRLGLSSVPSFYRTTLGIILDQEIAVTKKAESRFTRKNQHLMLDSARDFLRGKTFPLRLTRLVGELKTKGMLDLPTEPPIQLSASGDVAQGDLRANLRACAKQQRIEFGGSKYLYSVYDPDIVRIRLEGGSLFVRKMEFTLRMNRDVIMTLIKHLMEHDSL